MDLYEPVKRYLEGQFAKVAAGKTFHLEIAARKGFSEKVKAEIPDDRDIVFKFTKRPDILGFVKGQYTSNLITVEVKGNGLELDDIYQAKLYKEVFDARYGNPQDQCLARRLSGERPAVTEWIVDRTVSEIYI